jgi:hypothetical protein
VAEFYIGVLKKGGDTHIEGQILAPEYNPETQYRHIQPKTQNLVRHSTLQKIINNVE